MTTTNSARGHVPAPDLREGTGHHQLSVRHNGQRMLQSGWGVLLVHIGRFQQCPAGRGLPAAHGSWSSQSAKQPSPRCSRNDPRTALITLTHDGLGQPSRLAKLLSGPETALLAL